MKVEFLIDKKVVCSYSTYEGQEEIDATIELLAYEKNVETKDIEVVLRRRDNMGGICRVIADTAIKLHGEIKDKYLALHKDKINGCPCSAAFQEFSPCEHGVVLLPKIEVLTFGEAEILGKKQVEEQNQLMEQMEDTTRYKFLRVGNLDECWEGYKGMKYYQKYGRILLWRLDKSRWTDENEEGWEETPIIYKKEEGEDGNLWFCVADFA